MQPNIPQSAIAQLHTPVLLSEVLSFLPLVCQNGRYLDATLGYAGHASAILDARPDLELIGLDQDPFALECSRARLSSRARVTYINSNFKDAFAHVEPSSLRLVLADLGVSSVQLDFAERGFCFDSPVLDMRMNPAAPLGAADLLALSSAAELAKIFCDFGQLPPKLAADIAAKIKSRGRLNSCAELAALVGNATLKGRKIALKTLVFQAIRIAVNGELAALEQFLRGCGQLDDCLLLLISFHSLEDALIKAAFKRFEADCCCAPDALRCSCGGGHSLGKILTKKPLIASAAEQKANSRSSCAKLRAFYFCRDKKALKAHLASAGGDFSAK